jgi:hypothetical protein
MPGTPSLGVLMLMGGLIFGVPIGVGSEMGNWGWGWAAFAGTAALLIVALFFLGGGDEVEWVLLGTILCSPFAYLGPKIYFGTVALPWCCELEGLFRNCERCRSGNWTSSIRVPEEAQEEVQLNRSGRSGLDVVRWIENWSHGLSLGFRLCRGVRLRLVRSLRCRVYDRSTSGSDRGGSVGNGAG